MCLIYQCNEFRFTFISTPAFLSLPAILDKEITTTFFEFHFFNSEIENTHENRRRQNYSLLSSLTLYAMKAQKV